MIRRPDMPPTDHVPLPELADFAAEAMKIGVSIAKVAFAMQRLAEDLPGADRLRAREILERIELDSLALSFLGKKIEQGILPR